MIRESYNELRRLYNDLDRVTREKEHYESQLSKIIEKTEIRTIEFMYTTYGLHTFDINPDFSHYFVKTFKSYLNTIINIKKNEIQQIEKELDTYTITKKWRED